MGFRLYSNIKGAEWEPTIAQNFDNVLRGFSLLFEISTTEGWVNVMVSGSFNIAHGNVHFYCLHQKLTIFIRPFCFLRIQYAAIDQRGIDMQPIRGSNEIWAVYFIIFLLLGAFFLCELFVGVIIENFAR